MKQSEIDIDLQSEPSFNRESVIEAMDYFKEIAKRMPHIETDRLVFGKFVGDGSMLMILHPTYLKWKYYLNRDEDFSKNKNFDKPSSDYRFDFTSVLKNFLQPKETCHIYINDYTSNELFSSPDNKKVSIPKEWIKQRDKTFEETNYLIRSKVVFPIFIKKDKQDYLWGVAFIESTSTNIRDSIIPDYETFYLLIKKIGDLIVKITEISNRLSQVSILKNEISELSIQLDSKYSTRSLLLNSTLVSVALILTIIAWFGFNFPLIHPVISIPLLIGSTGFSFLSYLRIK